MTVGCSENAITLGYSRIIHFTRILTRIEERLQCDITSYDKTLGLMLPSFKKWKIVLWHISRDSLTEYGAQTFLLYWGIA